MRWFRRVLQLGLLLAVLIAGWRFAADNGTPVQVHYLFGQSGEVALWQALLAAFALGALAVGAFALLGSLRHGLVQRRYRKLVGGLESELHQLRNLPLAPDPEVPGGPRAAQRAATPGGDRGRET
jgi:uncharacterized integral membrane protein